MFALQIPSSFFHVDNQLSQHHFYPFCVGLCGRLNNGSPKMSTNKSLGTCDYVTFYGKRKFAGMMRLRISGRGDYLGLCVWAQCNHKGPLKREKQTWSQRNIGQKQRSETGVIRFEDRGRDHKPRVVRSL